jgi:hypothetical protein
MVAAAAVQVVVSLIGKMVKMSGYFFLPIIFSLLLMLRLVAPFRHLGKMEKSI